jgi:HD-GYP domain-containing protein (c-di-GMP phosphodiesterase class II)
MNLMLTAWSARLDGTMNRIFRMTNPPEDASPVNIIANALTVALGARDHYTRVHCDGVIQLSMELGQHIGLTEQELEQLALGARFHDLGKSASPTPSSASRSPSIATNGNA